MIAEGFYILYSIKGIKHPDIVEFGKRIEPHLLLFICCVQNADKDLKLNSTANFFSAIWKKIVESILIVRYKSL